MRVALTVGRSWPRRPSWWWPLAWTNGCEDFWRSGWLGLLLALGQALLTLTLVIDARQGRLWDVLVRARAKISSTTSVLASA